MTDASHIAAHTTESLAGFLAQEACSVALVPVGSVEPHGPHLSLTTDAIISRAAAERAIATLAASGIRALIAPEVAYGVTECARSFCGAVSIPPAVLTAYLRAIADGWLTAGFDHVCLINNHLEPAHDLAVRAAIHGAAPGTLSVACPLTRRWARTLSDEFKRGACHGGRYETSLVLATEPSRVDVERAATLAEVPFSLSDALARGLSDFQAMGLAEAYAGAPAEASAAEGEALLARLAEMIAGEICDALARKGPPR